MYYIVVDEKKVGPLALEELRGFYLRKDTLVWKEGLEGWTTAETLPELAPYISSYSSLNKLSDDKNGGGISTASRQTPSASETQRAAQEELVGKVQSDYSNSGHNEDPFFHKIMPKTWVLESLLVTFFCCNILGIIALAKALRVESNFLAGRYNDALKYSKDAKQWVLTTLFIGLAIYVIFILFYFLVFAAIIAEGTGLNI
ncbi:MAG: CD225/dispanin family protein [Porphyromonas sp.]|nr:CD225/dispanin family protein [Porphyromonas sp.]